MINPRALRSKIKSPAALKKILAKTKKKAVFTNGCFDLLHPGHARYLELARRKGDLLIVALNGDQSVKRLKGPTRPVNNLSHRLEVVAALESVDYVTWFEEDTPLALILSLSPKVLVKGGDWKVSEIVGGAEVKKLGGRVHSLKFIEGKSTTQIIKKVNQLAGLLKI